MPAGLHHQIGRPPGTTSNTTILRLPSPNEDQPHIEFLNRCCTTARRRFAHTAPFGLINPVFSATNRQHSGHLMRVTICPLARDTKIAIDPVQGALIGHSRNASKLDWQSTALITALNQRRLATSADTVTC